MQKEPFVITLGDEDLPNLASDATEDFGFEFSKTKLWREDNRDMIKLLSSINEKLDLIIHLMKQTGKD